MHMACGRILIGKKAPTVADCAAVAKAKLGELRQFQAAQQDPCWVLGARRQDLGIAVGQVPYGCQN